MKYTHFIDMRVFSKEEDNEDEIKKKIRDIFPFDFEKEKISVEEKVAYGFDEKKIIICSVSLKKERHTKAFIQSLMGTFDEAQKDTLRKQLESRLDSNLHFYIRLDKEKLMDGIYEITDSGNCFHFTFSIAAYPHKREIAIGIVKSMLAL